MDDTFDNLHTRRVGLIEAARDLHKATFEENVAAIPAAQTALDGAVSSVKLAADDMLSAVPRKNT
eukprot:392264-Prymnesium_polylepis.1